MNYIKQRVLNGRILAGVFASMGSACSVEIAGRAGLDWVLIDTEHGLGSEKDMVVQLYAAAAGGICPIVRIAKNDSVYFKRALDIGAAGIMVPQVNTAEDAAYAVKAMKYPPHGTRGLTRSSRASGFGFQIDEYLSKADSDLLSVIQIETKAAVENIDKIAAVDGVDVLFLGPSDLSCNLQVQPDLSNPRLAECIEKVCDSAKRNNKKLGILLKSPDQIETAVEQGFNLIACQTDMTIVRAGMKNIKNSFSKYK